MNRPVDPEGDYTDGKADDYYARTLVAELVARGVRAELDTNTGGGCRGVRAEWLLITDGDADYPTLSYGVVITDEQAGDVHEYPAYTASAVVADAIANVLNGE